MASAKGRATSLLQPQAALLLTFVAGAVLQLGAAIGEMENLGRPTLVNIFSLLRLLGLLMLVVSPVLMGVKFFGRLDGKPE